MSKMGPDKDAALRMYATSEPLAVRMRTHALYTQPPVSFLAWVLDHLSWRGDETVLDVGCGAGAYVEPVRQRLTRGGQLLALDLSFGMLRDLSHQALPGSATLFNADAMHLPLPSASCDIVLANHVLFHVPDIGRTVAEMRRVLRPSGQLAAATNARQSGEAFFAEMETACRALGASFGLPTSPMRTRFTLENGAEFIRPHFAHVERHTLHAALVFPAVDPVLAYLDSLRDSYDGQLPADLTWPTLLGQVGRQVRAVIAERGEYRVPKDAGVFIAT